MEKTVIAVFDTRQDAQLALDGLTEAGFSTAQARITSTNAGSGTDSVQGSAPVTRDEDKSIGEKIADFFGFGDDDETYSEAVRRGNCVLTVDAGDDEEADRAEAVMYRFNPLDIDQKAAEWRESGWVPMRARPGDRFGGEPVGVGVGASEGMGAGLSGGTASAGTAGTGAVGAGTVGADTGAGSVDRRDDETVIPVTEEQLVVGKRDVQRGGVRVISRTTEKPVEADVTLREERAQVTRRPVDRAVTDADDAFKDRSIEVRETAEEAVVSKDARVVEEVEVGKQTSTRDEKIRDTVRRTDVDVEQIGSRDGARDGRDGSVL